MNYSVINNSQETQMITNDDIPDSQKFEYLESESFGKDESQNYNEKFLRISNKIKPKTSTQLPYSQKFSYNKNASTTVKTKTAFKSSPTSALKSSPRNSQHKIIVSTSTSTSSHQASTSTSSHQASTSTSSQQATQNYQTISTNTQQTADARIEYLLTNILREIKCLRREVKELKEKPNSTSTSDISDDNIIIPCKTPEQFEELEKNIKTNKNAEKKLEAVFNQVLDQSLDKFVKNCLISIMENKVAVKYSLHGRNEKISIKSYHIINIIKECALKKFQNSRSTDILLIVKKWFNYTTDRIKRSKENSSEN